jgi:hypothetical protein
MTIQKRKKKEKVISEEMVLVTKMNVLPEGERRMMELKSRFCIILPIISHDFVKRNFAELAAQLNQFSDSLNGPDGPTLLAEKYSYTTAQLKQIKDDAAQFSFWNDKHGAGDTYKLAWTAKGEELLFGTGITITAYPLGVDVSGEPTKVLPGIVARFREKAKWAKGQGSVYSPGDGITMGIEVSSSPFVPADGKPLLKITISEGGHPKIEYIKSKYQGIRIYKDSGDGKGWVLLMTCNDPSGMDMSDLPATGLSAAWKYKAFYLYEGKEVGTISLEVPITVLGLV